MKISLLSAFFHLLCHTFYLYLQLKFQKFSTVGLVALTIWVINDKYLNFWAKAVGIPIAILLHLYGSVHDLMVLEWVAYVAVILLSFLRKEPPLPSRKFSARPITLDKSAISVENESLYQQFPTSPLSSPNRRMQSVGFVLPSLDEYENPPSSGDSPRILRSEEKLKRDKNKLQLALNEARAAEEKRISAAAAAMLRKKKS